MQGRLANARVRSLCVACAVALIQATAAARGQRTDDLIQRVGDWVHVFVEQFANIVAEEEYILRIRTLGPRLTSDFLLVRYPGSTASWQTFRDVVAVNGTSLRNQPERLSRLFLQPFESAIEQANAITKHSARYISPLSDPLLGIAVLQRHYQPRFRYTLGELDHGLGPGVRRIRFEETATPTILRTDSNRDLPTAGTAWVVEATGRIVRTEFQIGELKAQGVVLSTAFKRDETLGIHVPVTMQVDHMLKTGSSTRGTAYYTRFRRFTVRTSESIDTPAR